MNLEYSRAQDFVHLLKGSVRLPLSVNLSKNEAGDVESVLYQHFYDRIHDSVSNKFLRTFFSSLVAEDGDHLLEGYLYKLGGTLMSNWPRKYFHLFPNRLEWRGEQAGVCFLFPTKVSGGHAHRS